MSAPDNMKDPRALAFLENQKRIMSPSAAVNMSIQLAIVQTVLLLLILGTLLWIKF